MIEPPLVPPTGPADAQVAGPQTPTDPTEATTLAEALGISTEAVEVARGVELIDLHLDTLIPMRLWGYDPLKRHRRGPFGRRFFGHLDLPRALDGGLSGGMWSVTTQPFRGAKGRWRAFQRNSERLHALAARSSGEIELVRTASEYHAARARGAHAAMLAIQGGHALQAAPEGPASVPDRWLVRVTLVHLTSSTYGGTSSPFHRLHGSPDLRPEGRLLVEQLDAERVFVDLAHIHPAAFWQAIDAHDRALPLICTHTGVRGMAPHWRNLSDDQLRAIADTGGVVGVMFHTGFLRRKGGPKDHRMLLEHLEHIIRVVGEDHAAIGSDYDGAITPPEDMPGAHTYPVLIQGMLDRGWSPARIEKIAGANFLRSFAALRPG